MLKSTKEVLIIIKKKQGKTKFLKTSENSNTDFLSLFFGTKLVLLILINTETWLHTFKGTKDNNNLQGIMICDEFTFPSNVLFLNKFSCCSLTRILKSRAHRPNVIFK